jgi:hypothetical protein
MAFGSRAHFEKKQAGTVKSSGNLANGVNERKDPKEGSEESIDMLTTRI